MKNNDKTDSRQQNESHKDSNSQPDAHNNELLNAQSLLQDSENLSYDELLHRFETLLQRAEKLRASDQREVAEGLLAGAEELLLRQDEIGTDFTIAIIALNEQASQQILAVIRKSE